MSNTTTTYYTLNADEKGLRGNIGKKSLQKSSNGETYIDVMLFVVANGNSKDAPKPSKTINVHFPEAAAKTLNAFNVGDYVRINFERIDLVERMQFEVNHTGKNTTKKFSSVIVKANNIELLRRANDKAVQPKTTTQSVKRAAWAK